jgi:hypothetical protein
MDGLIGLVVFAVFAVLWIAFGAAIVLSQGSLDGAWQWLRGLPLIFQGVVALLLLPVVIGLWVWETSWPLVARLVVVGGLAVWTAYMFFPRSLVGR